MKTGLRGTLCVCCATLDLWRVSQILRLREDYRTKMGDAFSLDKFHEEFMSQGEPPLAVLRKAMLGDDSAF